MSGRKRRPAGSTSKLDASVTAATDVPPAGSALEAAAAGALSAITRRTPRMRPREASTASPSAPARSPAAKVITPSRTTRDGTETRNSRSRMAVA